MAPPAAERSAGVLVLDRASEAAGELALPTLGRDPGEEADTEYASGSILQLICQLEGCVGPRLRLLDAA